MNSPNNWNDMGISDDELFTMKGLPYWRNVPQHSFLSAITHEIASENSQIQACIKVILNGSDETKPIDQRQLLGFIQNSSEKIRKIIQVSIEYNKEFQK